MIIALLPTPTGIVLYWPLPPATLLRIPTCLRVLGHRLRLSCEAAAAYREGPSIPLPAHEAYASFSRADWAFRRKHDTQEIEAVR